MSDQSDSSTLNGEWDNMSEPSVESKNTRTEMITELTDKIKNLERCIRARDNTIRFYEWSNDYKEGEIEKLEQENAQLISRIEQFTDVFIPSKRMKEKIEEMHLANSKVIEKTKEMYMAISLMGKMKVEMTSWTESRQMTVDILRLEEICVKTSNNVLKVNSECLKEITENINRLSEDVRNAHYRVKNKPSIDRFLGEYKPDKFIYWKSIEIKKADKSEYYEACFTNENGETTKNTWIPDNEERYGVRAWLAGEVLNVSDSWGVPHRFEICEKGIKYDVGYLFVRI